MFHSMKLIRKLTTEETEIEMNLTHSLGELLFYALKKVLLLQ